MRINIFILLFFLSNIPTYIYAQSEFTTLVGKVIILNTNISPKPLQVISKGLSTSVEVDVDGTFEMKFPFNKPGEVVNIEIIKPGYEVINEEALSIVLRTEYILKPIPTIIIAKIGSYAKSVNELNYHFTKNYKGPITKEVLELSQNLSKELAKIDKRINSPELFEAKELLKKGKLIEASKSIDETDIFKDIIKCKENIRNSEKSIAQEGQNILENKNSLKEKTTLIIIKAKTEYFLNNISKAKYLLDSLYKLDSLNISIILEIGDFYAAINNFTISNLYYNKALGYDIPDNIKARILSALITDNLYLDKQNDISKYIELSENLISNSKSIQEYYLTYLINSIGAFYTDEGNLKKSSYYLNKSLTICTKYDKNKNWNLVKLEILMNLENLAFLENDSIGFENISHKTLSICNDIINKEIKLIKLSEEFHKKGRFYYKYNNNTKSRIEFSKAYKILDSLYKVNSFSHSLSYARLLYDLASLENNPEKQDNLFQKAINIISKSYKIDPYSYKEIIYTYNKNFCFTKSNYTRSKILDSACSCALKLLDTIHLEKRFKNLQDAIELLNRIGYNRLIESDYSISEKYFTNSLKYLINLNDSLKPKRYYELKYSNELNLFEIYRLTSTFHKADSMLSEAYETISHIDTPKIYKEIIYADFLYNKGILIDLSPVQYFKNIAIQNFLEAINIYSTHITKLNNKNLKTYSNCLYYVGIFYKTSDRPKAIHYLKKSENIKDSLNNIEKFKHAYLLATIKIELSKIFNTDSTCESVLNYLRKAEVIVNSNNELFNVNNNFQIELQEFYGDILLFSKDPKSAKTHYLEAIKYSKKAKRKIDINRISNKIIRISP